MSVLLPSPPPVRTGGPAKVTLLVRSHGRWEYLHRAVTSLADIHRETFARKVLSLDGPVSSYLEKFGEAQGWEVLSTGPERLGLAANVAQAWGALTADDEIVLDWEEDFLALDVPLAEMVAVLGSNRDLAQVALVRQPWSPEEHAAGGLLYGPNLAGDFTDQGGWLRQERIFTLNPYVARASLLRSLQPGVETDLTSQCLARGLSFGYLGSASDPPKVLHIGASGGMGSEGWRA